jgi:hypothetical protein
MCGSTPLLLETLQLTTAASVIPPVNKLSYIYFTPSLIRRAIKRLQHKTKGGPNGNHLLNINIKKLQSTFKKSCYRPCSHRSKTAKIKRERERGRERDSGNSSSYEAYNTIA